MAEDWASKIRESIQRSNKAVDLYQRQGQAAMANFRNGNKTNYTALDTGGIADIPSFTPAPAGMTADRFSGAPIESASFYGSGQINEIKPPEDYEEGQGGGEGQGGAPTPNRRPRRPSTPMKRNYMGSAGGGGLDQHAQNQRSASSWENLQRRSNYMPPSQQTPRQRFAS
jgi:hypothetical protein